MTYTPKAEVCQLFLAREARNNAVLNLLPNPTHMVRRKTLGQRLREARENQNLTVDELVERIQNNGGKTKETTIRQIEKGNTLNPGIKTLEEIAYGLHLPPMEVLSWGLDDPAPEKRQRYSESRFALVSEVYESLPPGRKVFYDEVLDMVIDRMQKG